MFETMSNKLNDAQKNDKKPGIELPPEELSGQPDDRVPGLQTQEDLETAATGALAEKQATIDKFKKFDKGIERASTEKLKEFIEFCEKGMNNDQAIVKFPDLKQSYIDLRTKALKRLGMYAAEVLPITKVFSSIKAAEQVGDMKSISLMNMAKNDLEILISALNMQMQSGVILEANKAKINEDLDMAKELMKNRWPEEYEANYSKQNSTIH